MGFIIKKGMEPKTRAGMVMKVIGKIVTNPYKIPPNINYKKRSPAMLVIITYGNNGKSKEEIWKELDINFRNMLFWDEYDWDCFLRKNIYPIFKGGLYYVINMRGNYGLDKVFGPKYLD